MSEKSEMPDVLAAEVTPGSTVVLNDGKTYRLSFPIKAVILYKQKTGLNLFHPKNWEQLADPETLLAGLWAALCQYHPEVSYDDLGLLVDLSNIGKVETAIVSCITSYLPKVTDEIPNG